MAYDPTTQTVQPPQTTPSAQPTQPMQSVRGLLNQNGINNSQIGYDQNRNMVQVNGRDFMQPQKNYNGTTFTDQPTFNQAYSTYQKSQTPTPASTGAGLENAQPGVPAQYTSNNGGAWQRVDPNAQGNGQSAGMSPLHSILAGQAGQQPGITQQPVRGTDFNSLLAQLQGLQNQSPVDPYSTPQYAAAQAEQQRQQGLATRQLQESMGASGFGRSTNLSDRIQQNQTDSQNYLNTTALPSIIQQLQAQHQSQISNLSSLIGLLDTHQNNLFSQGIATKNQQLAEDAQRGYASFDPNATSIISKILADKQNYATDPNASTDANALRSQLAGLGVDPSLFGSNVTLDQAQKNLVLGAPTLQKQGQDFSQGMATKTFDQTAQNNKFSQGIQTQQLAISKEQMMAQLTGKMPDGTPTNAAQQQNLTNLWQASDEAGVINPTLAKMYGIPLGTPTQAAKQAAMQTTIAKAGLTGSLDGKPTLQAQGQTFNQNLQTKQFDNTVTQQQIQNGQWSKTFDEQMKQWAATNKLDWSKFNQDTKIALAQVAISQQNANTSSFSAKTTAAHDAASIGIQQQNADKASSAQNMSTLMDIWKNSGSAPAGIPGVSAGTPFADASTVQKEQSRLFTIWRDTGKAPAGITGVAEGTPLNNPTASRYANMNSNESDIAKGVDGVPPANRKAALQGEKAAIIGKVGAAGYTKIYNLYFDQFGNPK